MKQERAKQSIEDNPPWRQLRGMSQSRVQKDESLATSRSRLKKAEERL
jgi:hypothetical protein